MVPQVLDCAAAGERKPPSVIVAPIDAADPEDAFMVLHSTDTAMLLAERGAYGGSQWFLRYSMAAPQKKAKRPASSLRP